MNVGSLFSGIGGFDLGLERAGFEIEWQVENNEYCRAVLRKHWPAVPCHYDITTIDWRNIPRVDLVCGGFPCQPFSFSGKRRGAEDDRYLWPEVVRCLSVLKPTWFIGENVPGLINLGLDQVLSDLERLGYETAVFSIPACAVDAPHIRQRLWILAYTEGDLRRASGDAGLATSDGSHSLLADAAGVGRRQRHPDTRGSGKRAGTQKQRTGFTNGGGWPAEPDVGGMVNGLSEELDRGEIDDEAMRAMREGDGTHEGRDMGHCWPPEPDTPRVACGVKNRVDRLKGLGNAVVPAIVEALGKMILEVAHDARK